MALNVRHPVWLPAAPKPGIGVFAGLYLIETFARASLATVVPIQALDLLGDEQTVSFAYSAVGLSALGFSLIIPTLIRLTARRWIYTLGGAFLFLAAVCFVTFTVSGQLVGMMARVMGTACLNVTLNLYVLDHIARHSYVRNDSVRLALSTIGWTVTPYLGVWLYTNHGAGLAFGLSAASSTLLIALFWYLRLSDRRILRPGRAQPANPLWAVKRFAQQPRLRLAWLIAFGRSSFWSTFFVYGPILMVTGGMGKEAGGILVSLGNATLIATLVWGKLAERVRVRKVATLAFAMMAVALYGAAAIHQAGPIVQGGFLLLTALFATALDSVGGVPFYRSVRPMERVEMTAVYRTYLDFGELLPPMIYGILLGFFGLSAVWMALGTLMIFCSLMCWYYLHQRL